MEPRPSDFWRQLVYRWFVQYNPAYLLSAALVFAGCFLWSRAVVHEGSLTGTLGIALVADLYAVSLIGGAALLTRIGLRRPAVMLALIFIVYQWDTTLHTETCAYLGRVGALAAAVWFAVFVGKLYALGWALRVRFDSRLVAAAMVAAAGLALGPWVLPEVGAHGDGALLAVWVFALGSLVRGGGITSTAPLEEWGQTVLRRATRTAWVLSGALVSLHVLWWYASYEVSLAPTLLAMPLLAVQRIQGDRRRWAIVVGTLILAAVAQPGAFFVTSLAAAAALGMRRSWPGALFAGYLGLWTARWSGGPWPTHVIALDVALTVVVAVALWRTRVRAALLVPLAASYAHFVVQARLVPAPTSTAGWGETIIGLGFALLGGSLFTSYRLRGFKGETPDPPTVLLPGSHNGHPW